MMILQVELDKTMMILQVERYKTMMILHVELDKTMMILQVELDKTMMILHVELDKTMMILQVELDKTTMILHVELDRKWNRGRPKLRWRDQVKEDKARNHNFMTTEMAEDTQHKHVVIPANVMIEIAITSVTPPLANKPPLLRHDGRTATKFGTHIRIDMELIRT